MKTLYFLLTLGLGVMVCACGEGQRIDQDEAAIRTLHAEWLSVVENLDIEGWVNLWSEDALMMEPNRMPHVGHDGVRAQAAFFDQVTIEDLDVMIEELEVAGDWAFIRQTFKGTWVPKDSRPPYPEHSKEIIILKRQPDNSWRIARYIWNSNEPAPSDADVVSDNADNQAN